MNRPALDKRITPRFAVGDNARALYGENAYPIRDLSLGGAFIDDPDPLPAGSTAYVTLYLSTERFSLEGLVRRSLPGQGMGIQFRNVPLEVRNRLEKYLNTVAQTAESSSKSPAPSPSVKPTTPPAASTARAGPPATTAAEPGAEEPGMSGRLKTLTLTLRELEEDIKGGNVDTRVLSEFRESVDHIRHTARAVQQWVEREAQNRDPYSVLPLLINDRIQRATRLTQEISLDLDAQEVSHETEGVDSLFEAVTQLENRLARLCKKQTA
jgi:hypothetical protein